MRRPARAPARLLGIAAIGWGAAGPAPALADDGGAAPPAPPPAARVCQTCHGRDGLAPLPQVPHLAGQDAWYLAEQLKAFRAGTRRNPQMDVVAKTLSDQDIADLAAWYAGFTIAVTGRR